MRLPVLIFLANAFRLPSCLAPSILQRGSFILSMMFSRVFHVKIVSDLLLYFPAGSPLRSGSKAVLPGVVLSRKSALFSREAPN